MAARREDSNPNRQIRSLVLRVGLVGSRRIWPAQVGGVVGPDGSRPVPSDRLDDQADDQVPGRSLAWIGRTEPTDADLLGGLVHEYRQAA
jgi:hypothetical protein